MADHRFPGQPAGPGALECSRRLELRRHYQLSRPQERPRLYRRLSLGLPATTYVTWSPSPKG